MAVAILPMYDWPEIRPQTEALWRGIGDALRARGIEAPAALTRDVEPHEAWLSPDLVLGQTCGLPYVTELRGRVALLGSPAYALGVECRPGDYHSVVVVPMDSEAQAIADLRGARVAYNAPTSQSGYSALRALVAPLSRAGRFFGECLRRGTHRESIRALAAGDADCAAVDAVSWALARRHEPAARSVRVLARTRDTPGLPYITGAVHALDASLIAEAVEEAIASLAPAIREALLLVGFRQRTDREYDVVSDMVDRAHHLGYPRLA